MGIKYNEHGDSFFWYTVNILMVSRLLFDLQILRVKSLATVHELTKLSPYLRKSFYLGILQLNWTLKSYLFILKPLFSLWFFNGYTYISDTPVNISFVMWSHNQEKVSSIVLSSLKLSKDFLKYYKIYMDISTYQKI